MKIPAFALATLLPISATPGNPLLPVTWFQQISATDGSTQHCVLFTTVPGVGYTYEFSHDLAEWTAIGGTYGLGHEFAAAMFETAPAPPPPDPENPPAAPPALTSASLTIRPSSGAEGGTVVSWASLDHGNAVSALIPGNMSPDWQTVPLFTGSHGSHQFFIIHASDAGAPPGKNPQLGDLDAAMIADLGAGWADFNAAVSGTAETARNTPPPPPPSLGARGFWRIRADWTLDSDNDGSFDHAELALAALPPGADGLAGNAFSADTNNDGIPDGEQLDSDGDSIPDARDIAPGDGGIAYANVALPRYAMFTFADTPEGSFAINDLGTVLFPGKVWKAGAFQNLITDQAQIPGYDHPAHAGPDLRARAINDHDRIIGAGTRFMPGGADPWYFDALIHWPSPQAVPAFVSVTQGADTTHAELRDSRHAVHLDNAGNFFSPAFLWKAEAAAGPPGEDAGWKKWTLPEGDNPLLAAPAAEFTKGTDPGGIVWGSEYAELPGPWLGSRITAPFELEIPIDPRDILAQGGNGNLVATRSTADASTRIAKNGEWLENDLLARASDLADNGTAIGTPGAGDTTPSILLNGKWTPLSRAAPALPERWKTSPAARLSDTSPGGWILAHDHPGGTSPDDLSAALIPIRLAGVPDTNLPGSLSTAEATGVDDFSVGASVTDPAAQDRLWIMAPAIAGETALHFHTPAHATAPITISAPGVTFNGEDELTLDGPSVPASIRATGTQSGDEIFAQIFMGDNESVSRPIGFKVMKARTVRVALYRVHLSQNGIHNGPEFYPLAPFLEDYLTKVFLRQINTDIIVTREDTPIVLDWDSNQNGYLDAVDGGVLSQDQILVDNLRAAKEQAARESRENTDPNDDHHFGPDVAPDIRIYFMGGPKRVDDDADGYTDIPTATAWISADEENNIRADRIPRTVAHEIGHIFFGTGHPDKGTGPAVLPGTEHHRRLMVSARTTGLDSGVLTVKGEWNAAQVNLRRILGEEGE